jgi:hypothetical protein
LVNIQGKTVKVWLLSGLIGFVNLDLAHQLAIDTQATGADLYAIAEWLNKRGITKYKHVKS